MKTILFRADSSSDIGTGHIMRDLVLVSRYKDATILFAVRDLDGNINHKITEAGYKTLHLETNDKEELLEVLKTWHVDVLVIDHYAIDNSYERYLKENYDVKILAFDDTYEQHNCDILLNHNISANAKQYKNLVPKDCELRCGSKYTLIRDEFIEEKKKNKRTRTTKKTIFVSMGGSDHSNIILRILKSIPKNYKVIVVTTTANKNLKKLKKFVSIHKMLELYVNYNNIASLMSKSDFAIISPSVISHEVIYMQLPFISILTGSDQRYVHEYFKKQRFLSMGKFNQNKLYNNIHKLDSNLRLYKNKVRKVFKR